ncbi:MAG: S24 family peptidase [Rhodospirillales bacterium]|nr:S24 family peptidase [Rhodospirillales bacterium]
MRRAAAAGQGESMAPTFPAGSSILVHRGRTWRRDRQIFVVRAAEEMVVKRAVRDEDGAPDLAYLVAGL